MTVAPWPARSVDAAGEDAARMLGEVFDGTVAANEALRPIANSWVAWGAKATIRTCQTWAACVDKMEAAAGKGAD